MFDIFWFFGLLATFAVIDAEGTLKQRNGYHYITGKGCGISTPIKYLEEIPVNIEGMSCTIIRPKKLIQSQKIEDLHDHWRFKPIEDCEFKNFDIHGFGMHESSTEADKFECARKCRDHKQCEFFVFLENSGYCSLRWLLTREPMPADPVAYSDLVSSYKSCTFPQNPIEACQFHNLELGSDGKYIGKTEDEYECARKCRADERCQGFVFCTADYPFEAAINDCFFKWNFGSPHTPYRTFKGLKSGYDSCRNDYKTIEECEFRAMDIPKAQIDSEIVLTNVPDEKSCARKCQKNVECDFFVYHTEETDHYKNCVLKFGIDGAEVVRGTGLLSSYRTCKFL